MRHHSSELTMDAQQAAERAPGRLPAMVGVTYSPPVQSGKQK